VAIAVRQNHLPVQADMSSFQKIPFGLMIFHTGPGGHDANCDGFVELLVVKKLGSTAPMLFFYSGNNLPVRP
jgi:hypothetical protein